MAEIEPAIIPLTIMKGDDYSIEIQLVDDETGEPLDLTGYTATSEIRTGTEPDDTLIKAFTVDFVDPPTATLKIKLTDTESGAIAQSSGNYSIKYKSSGGIDETYVVGPVTFDTNPTPTVPDP